MPLSPKVGDINISGKNVIDIRDLEAKFDILPTDSKGEILLGSDESSLEDSEESLVQEKRDSGIEGSHAINDTCIM